MRSANHIVVGLLRMAVSDRTPRHALTVAVVVGTILTIVNHGDLLLAGQWPGWVKVILTYVVPYCVATYGAVSAKWTYAEDMAARGVSGSHWP